MTPTSGIENQYYNAKHGTLITSVGYGDRYKDVCFSTGCAVETWLSGAQFTHAEMQVGVYVNTWGHHH